MVDPTLVITIDRTSLELPPLVLSGAPGSELGITDYTEPAEQTRVEYAPQSRIVHGATSIGAALQQTILPFSFLTLVDTETESRALVAQVRAAVAQTPTFQVTVSVSDAPDETWTCDPGSVTSIGSRTRVNLMYPRPIFAVDIPCYPIRSVA